MPSQPRLEILKPKELVILIIYYKVLWLPGRGRGGKKKEGNERGREGGRATAARCFVVKSKQEMNEFFSGIIRQCANVLPRPTTRPTPPPSNRKTQSQTAFILTSCAPLPAASPLSTCHKILSGKKRKSFQCPSPSLLSLFLPEEDEQPQPLALAPPLWRAVC